MEQGRRYSRRLDGDLRDHGCTGALVAPANMSAVFENG
jgi:hypothetical protein